MSFVNSCFASGSLAQLRDLQLWRNKIGDVGMQAFASAVASGSLPDLTHLYINKNQIGDDGMVRLAAAITSGWLPNLETVHWLDNPSKLRVVEKAMENRSA